VTVTLSYMQDMLVLDIHDDGRGFDAALPVAGFGLAHMRERARAQGGSLIIESVPGQGTTIVAEFPLTEALAHAHSHPDR
jgi:signal transduction histidine kinase